MLTRQGLHSIPADSNKLEQNIHRTFVCYLKLGSSFLSIFSVNPLTRNYLTKGLRTGFFCAVIFCWNMLLFIVFRIIILLAHWEVVSGKTRKIRIHRFTTVC